MSVPFMWVDGNLTLILNNKAFQIIPDHTNYKLILEALPTATADELLELVDIEKAIQSFSHGQVEVKNGKVLYQGEEVHGSISKRILEFMSKGLPFQPLVNFLHNLMENPSMQSQKELYDFLEHEHLPVTEDGHFLAYKAVRSDYMDKYAGKSCTVNDEKPIVGKNGPIIFDPCIKGDSTKQYVMGVDPASEQDNFSIIILEIHEDHRRIVYCWTTNRSNFRDRQKTGLVKEHDFYGFCARKIRNLMKSFPCLAIGMDAQGGGVAVEEALHDLSKMEDGEQAIWPIIDYNKAKETDHQVGLHILELVQFARADWVAQANHGLRKDFEDKIILFPRFDSLSIGLALENEGKNILEADLNPLYDSFSECLVEIEELKNELTTIVMTQTGQTSGARDRWDTPETKTSGGKKGKLRKDRYSSLIIANMIARQMTNQLQPQHYDIIGGNTRNIVDPKDHQMYKGPSWFTDAANEDIYI